MGTITLFFDTYAFFEILKKNPNYEGFLQKFSIITTKLNLMEFYYGLLKNYSDVADFVYDHIVQYCIEIDDAEIKEAMKLKLEHKELSYVDCLGYTVAMRHGVKFLTGDRGFKDMKSVEFVQ